MPRLVVDASVVVAALTEPGTDRGEAARTLVDRHLIAPALLPFEVANVVRRQVASRLTQEQGRTAIRAAQVLVADLHPFAVVAPRVWGLRANLTAYDASCVALAELLGVPLCTLDRRLARASGIRCEVIVPADIRR